MPRGRDTLTEVAEAMREMAAAMMQQARTQSHAAVDRTTLADFRRNDPPYFRGEYDPEKAEEWLQSVEDILVAMECPDERKVSHASFQLLGDAKVWWKACQKMLETRGERVTWEVFKTMFLEKYFPISARSAKEVEFNKLYQGNMTIAEYTAKFESLAKYCKYLQLTSDEEWKCRKYEDGLRYEIKRVVIPLGIKSFPELMDKCKMIEDMDRAQRNKNMGHDSKNGRSNVGPMHKEKTDRYLKPYDRLVHRHVNGYARNDFVGGNSKQFQQSTPKCWKCGQGHMTKDCSLPGPVCFICNKSDHLAKDCLSNKKLKIEEQKGEPSKPVIRGRVYNLRNQGASNLDNLKEEKGKMVGQD